MAPTGFFFDLLHPRTNGDSGCPAQSSECESPIPTSGSSSSPSGKPNLVAAHIVFSVVLLVVVFIVVTVWILVRRHAKRPIIPCMSRGKTSASEARQSSHHSLPPLPNINRPYRRPPGLTLESPTTPTEAHLDNKWRPVEEFNTFDHDPTSPVQIHVLRESPSAQAFPQEPKPKSKRQSSSLASSPSSSSSP